MLKTVFKMPDHSRKPTNDGRGPVALRSEPWNRQADGHPPLEQHGATQTRRRLRWEPDKEAKAPGGRVFHYTVVGNTRNSYEIEVVIPQGGA